MQPGLRHECKGHRAVTRSAMITRVGSPGALTVMAGHKVFVPLGPFLARQGLTIGPLCCPRTDLPQYEWTTAKAHNVARSPSIYQLAPF